MALNQPSALLQFQLDFGGWYDRKKKTLNTIKNVQYVCTMNPQVGAHSIDPRFQGHFAVFSVMHPSLDDLTSIYGSILDNHFSRHHFVKNVADKKVMIGIVSSVLEVHKRVAATFRPTPSKFHYQFSPRDISKVFDGIQMTNGETVSSPFLVVKLWLHEIDRVYRDRLVDDNDVAAYEKIEIGCHAKIIFTMLALAMVALCCSDSTSFVAFEFVLNIALSSLSCLYCIAERTLSSVVTDENNIICHFLEKHVRSYQFVPHAHKLQTVLEASLKDYNAEGGVVGMDLVLFHDAIRHICRINRILELSNGTGAMLVGVGGSGKQSLTRLAAFVSGWEIQTIPASLLSNSTPLSPSFATDVQR